MAGAAPPLPQHSPKLRRVHPCRYRNHPGKVPVGKGQETIRVGHHPFDACVAPRCRLNGWCAYVHPKRRTPGSTRQVTEVKAIAASRIEQCICGRCTHAFGDCRQQRRGYSRIMQPPPRCHRRLRVARLPTAPILRLQQVYIPAPGHVKGVPPGANQPSFFPDEGLSAIAHRAKKHPEQCSQTAEVSSSSARNATIERVQPSA